MRINKISFFWRSLAIYYIPPTLTIKDNINYNKLDEVIFYKFIKIIINKGEKYIKRTSYFN